MYPVGVRSLPLNWPSATFVIATALAVALAGISAWFFVAGPAPHAATIGPAPAASSSSGQPPRTAKVLIDAAWAEGAGSATGFFIGPGELVTCWHAIHPAKTIRVVTGVDEPVETVGVVASDEEADLAVLRFDEPRTPSRPATLSTTLPQSGEPVTIAGWPGAGSIRAHVVDVVDMPGYGVMIRMDPEASAGWSGAPVLNSAGEVIGIVCLSFEGHCFATPASRVAVLRRADPLPVATWVERHRTLLSEANARRQAAEAIYDNGRPADAIAALRQLLHDRPDDWRAATSLLSMLLEEGWVQEAAELAERSAFTWPELGDAHAHLGVCYIRMERWSEAAAAYEQAVRCGPAVPEWTMHLARLYGMLGRTDAMLERYTEVPVNSRRGVAYALDAAGELADAGRLEEAVRVLDRALAIEPGNPEVRARRDALRPQELGREHRDGGP